MAEGQTNNITSNSSSDKPYTMDPNVEAALAYLFSPITGIVVYMMEKNNKFVRFHAFQSILFGVASVILWTIASLSNIILIGFILMPLLGIGLFLYWLFLMWKAYNNEEYEIPFLGKIARDQLS